MVPISFVFSTWNSPLSWLISLFTWSLWSHVELLVRGNAPENDLVYSAWYPGGVRGWLLSRRIAGARKCLRADLRVTPAQAQAITAFVLSEVGKPYDLLGAIGLGFRRDWQRDDAWFCSELCAAALVHAGVPGTQPLSNPITKPSRITPGRFLKLLRGLGATWRYYKPGSEKAIPS